MKNLKEYIFEDDKKSYLKSLKEKILGPLKKAKKEEISAIKKYADNDNITDKKFKNAWCLVITKVDCCLKPDDIIAKYYYLINDKDDVKNNHNLAVKLWDKIKIPAYNIIVKNPKYDPYACDDGTSMKTGEKIDNFESSMIWQALTYNFELDCNYSVGSLIHKINEQTKKGYDKPKKVESFEELEKIWQKVEDLYRKKEKETSDFLDTPLDKIDAFKFELQPQDIDI